MKVLVSEKILDEANISDKNKERFLAAGLNQDVYKSNDKNLVYKFSKKSAYNDIEAEKYEFMQKYPEYFPKIVRLGKKYAVVEKLNSEAAKKDFLDINRILYKNFEISLKYVLINLYDNIETDNKIYKKALKRLFPVFEKFTTLIQKISKVKYRDLDFLDIHAGNFAYDKDGNLKMIDI